MTPMAGDAWTKHHASTSCVIGAGMWWLGLHSHASSINPCNPMQRRLAEVEEGMARQQRELSAGFMAQVGGTLYMTLNPICVPTGFHLVPFGCLR